MKHLYLYLGFIFTSCLFVALLSALILYRSPASLVLIPFCVAGMGACIWAVWTAGRE